MYLIVFLILFPLVVSAALFFIKDEKQRSILVISGAGVIGAASIFLVASGIASGPLFFKIESEVIDLVGTIVGIVVASIIIYFGLKFKNRLAIILAGIQVVLSLVFEIFFAPRCQVQYGLYYDQLSLMLTFIIGVIGSAIIVYALGYMKDFQQHQPKGTPDKRPFFFCVMFLFLSAMYVIVFSNNMVWLFIGWEVTTLCSFLLIGYTRTSEAIKNAFRQINMNLVGGIAFVLALYSCVVQVGTLDFYQFIQSGSKLPQIVVFSASALALAGITKAAQMPFHTWLLGAMVAPTPTSALLHSSTMVKAGVFLLVKLSPVFLVCSLPSYMLLIIGGFTFLSCSIIAISQSNAKRVLAYSTIANLGLIAACAAAGTPEAVWAASFLILFHAIAKSLLFLCVGTAEHHIGSRNIEDMDLLFERMPRLARCMMVGMLCMFIAPFGMLIAKWAGLVSFVDAHHYVVVIMLAFGSAATFMFWVKWFGKLSGIAGNPENVELTIHKTEWFSLATMLCLILVCCTLIPVLSALFVEPFLIKYYGTYGLTGQSINDVNLWIMAVIALIVFLIIMVGLRNKTKQKKVPVYLSGISVNNNERTFRDSMSGETFASARNWYMKDWFAEEKLTSVFQVGSTVYIASMVLLAAMSSFM